MIVGEYIDILLKRRLIIAIVTVIALAASYFAATKLPETYESTAYLRVLPYSASDGGFESAAYFDRLTQTLVEISGTVSLGEQLRKQLDVNKTPEYSVELVTGTELLKVAASDEDPKQAQRIVSLVANLMLDQPQISNDGGIGYSVERLEQELETAENDLNVLQDEYNDLLVNSPFEVDKINALQKRIVSQQSVYDILLRSYTQANITRTMRIGSVSLAEAASLPTQSSSRSRRLTLLMGGVLGLLGGTVLALVFEAFDRRVYSTETIKQLTDLPIIGSVPHLGWMDRRSLSSRHSAAQSYRRIAVHISQGDGTGPKGRVVLFCSAQPGEGKSTLVANLALALVEQGYKAVIVDGDLHRSGLNKVFGIKVPQERWYDRLIGRKVEVEAVQEKILRKTRYGVDLVLPAQLAPERQRGLSKTLMPSMIGDLRKNYEIVLIDSPAVMAVADALEMVKFSNSVVLVARRTQTRQTMFRDAFEYLSQVNANWIGVVLNDDKPGSNKRWYQYHN